MKFELYRDVANQYRWRLVADNGRRIGDSGEGYVNHSDCLGAINLVKRDAPSARIEDSTKSGYSGAWR